MGKNIDEAEKEARADQAKGKAPKLEGYPELKAPIRCFRCQKGHHQLDYTNDPICYKCKQTGHMASEYGNSSKFKMNMFGFGIPRHRFYSIDIPNVKTQFESAHELVTIL